MNTKAMNLALMLKWIWRILSGDNEDLLWLRLLRAKYRRNNIFSTTPAGSSPF
jgi:hypothetical protein